MNRILALLFLLVVFQLTASADWHPVVRDMRGSSWWTGGQTWQIDTQSDGDVIVANRYGLYILNAQHKALADDLPDGAWRAITPNNHSEVRSSLRIKSRIYVGGINEFGYITGLNEGTVQIEAKAKENKLIYKENDKGLEVNGENVTVGELTEDGPK